MAQLYRTLTGQSNKSATSTNPASPVSSTRPTIERTATVKGKLNHLSEIEVERFHQFKEKLQEQKWWTPDGVNGKPSHDDATLLRYLRARKFVVDDAIGQFTDTEKWMKDNKVEDLYQTIDVEFYEKARKMYPQWTGRRDKRGIPVYVYEIKWLDSKNVSSYQKDADAWKSKLPEHKDLSVASKLLPLFALYQNLLNFVLPFCSSLERPNPEIPVSNSNNIVDISGVGLGQFWNLKQHMQDASVLATAHYPETLDRIFIIGAPAFFPTVWGWIKRWFDPVTVSKIFILGRNEVKPTLEAFMEPQNIPKKYGGTLDWNWGDLPDLGPEELAAVERGGTKGWTPGPCMWLQGRRIPVGTVDGQPRAKDIDVDALRPVVYAADETVFPVHDDQKASLEGETAKASANGQLPEPQSASVDYAAPVVASAGKDQKAVGSEKPLPATSNAVDKSNLEVQKSPMGDSQVHIPDAQPSPPAKIAEYIPPSTSAAANIQSASTTTMETKNTQESATTLPSTQAPPGHTQPGPLTQHNVEVTKVIASKLEGESVSTLPAASGANGELPHPEVIMASDTSKGLAAETEKLQLGNQQNGRPSMERFVTATEVKP